MAQATYNGSYLSPEARLAIYTPTKLRNGEVNSEKYSLGWRVGYISLDDDIEQAWTVLHHGGGQIKLQPLTCWLCLNAVLRLHLQQTIYQINFGECDPKWQKY